MVLIKWWLLAIPQLIIVGILEGGGGPHHVFSFGLIGTPVPALSSSRRV